MFTSSEITKIDALSVNGFHTAVYQTFIESHNLNSTQMFKKLNDLKEISYETTIKKCICTCGSQFKSKAYILRHLKTKKHITYAKTVVQESQFISKQLCEWLGKNAVINAPISKSSSVVTKQATGEECPICFEITSAKQVACSQCVYKICEPCFRKCIATQRSIRHPKCPFCRIQVPTHILRKYRKPTRSTSQRDPDYIPPQPLSRWGTSSRLTRSQARANAVRNARFAESGIPFREIEQTGIRVLIGLGSTFDNSYMRDSGQYF